MRYWTALLVAGLMAFWAAFSASQAHADPGDIAAAARSVVRVVLVSDPDGNPQLIGHGSGFAIGPDLILTNAHVVDPAREDRDIRIGVVPSQGESGWFARIIVLSRTKDLALLKLTEPGSLPQMTFFTGPVADGADVFAVGYPGNVDLAQGLNVGDIVSPTSPVKTRGTVSTGRSSRQVETILHTAAIGGGNSGGPLLDTCGRVIGANTFGTISDGSDSEFYFAVSTREILRFLHAAEIKVSATGIACRSMADLKRAENDRLAGGRALSEEEARSADEKQHAAREKAQRNAMFDVMVERETGMAIAGLAMMLALAAGATAFYFRENQRQREAKLWAVAAGVLAIGAIVAWSVRPGLSAIDSRASELSLEAASSSGRLTSAKDITGSLVCTLDLERSRVTVSDPSDIELNWQGNGCDGKDRPFGLFAEGWSRVNVPGEEDTATVVRFDPATREYRTDRFHADLATMEKLRAEQKKLPSVVCGASEKAARALGEAQKALIALLPNRANERLLYKCTPAAGQTGK